METLQKFSIDLILSIQNTLMPTLDLFMVYASYLGEERFYMLIIPFLYWCVHYRVGVYLFVFLVVSVYVNEMFKWIFHQPRPHWIDSNVKALYHETSYGIPSGHAQNALGVWCYLAYLLRKFLEQNWFWYVAIGLAGVISFSRLYMGVHFLHDVVGGWILAITFLVVFIYMVPVLVNRYQGISINKQLIALVGATGLILIISLFIHNMVMNITDPSIWETNAALAHPPKPGQTTIQPKSAKIISTTVGLVLGVGIGYLLMQRYALFNEQGPWPKRILRFVFGVVGLFGIQIGLALLFPKSQEPLYMVFRSIRYFLITLWAIFLAPLLFIKLNLAEKKE